MDERDVSKEIRRLEKQMLEHARNLEFEAAAKVRDQLGRVKQQLFGATGASVSAGSVVPFPLERAA
jgi:excinuclease ABC subunit B